MGTNIPCLGTLIKSQMFLFKLLELSQALLSPSVNVFRSLINSMRHKHHGVPRPA
jgi:hypothetical protein